VPVYLHHYGLCTLTEQSTACYQHADTAVTILETRDEHGSNYDTSGDPAYVGVAGMRGQWIRRTSQADLVLGDLTDVEGRQLPGVVGRP
jgi:hypothetical protein